MRMDSGRALTYILENGDEKTVTLDSEILFDFVKWFQDAGSSNCYDLAEGIGKRVTMFKNTILAVRY